MSIGLRAPRKEPRLPLRKRVRAKERVETLWLRENGRRPAAVNYSN